MSVDEPADAVDLASSALLGALLWDQRRLTDVAQWLEPGDFREAQQRAIYRTLVAMGERGQPSDLPAVLAVLTSGQHQNDYTFPRREPRAALALLKLLEATPATPAADGPGEHTRNSEHIQYATLVLTDSVRRQVQAAGTALVQHAGEALAADQIASIGERVERLDRGLHVVARRLTELAVRLRSGLEPGTNGRSAGRAAVVSHAPRGGPAAAAVAELRGQERALLGSCLVSAQVRQVVAATLFPEDFVDAKAAATWQVMLDLHRRGRPIDYVLVAAEIEQRGGGAAGDRAGLGAAELAQLYGIHRSSSAPDAWVVLESVVLAALERVTATAHRSLQDAATDQTLSAAQVVQRAHTAVVHGGQAVRRLAAETSNFRPSTLTGPATSVPAPRSSGQQAAGTPTRRS